MRKIYILLLISVLTTVCLGQGYTYTPWQPSMGPLNFNTLGDTLHPYVQCMYGSSYNNPTNIGISVFGDASSHAIITSNEPDPCRCYTINGQAYVHETYLPQSWNGAPGEHQDTVIRIGCGTTNSICNRASQIEYWFYPKEESSTLLVMSSFAIQNGCASLYPCSHGVEQGCGSIRNPQFYIEVLDGETDQLLDLGYYPTQASQQTANPVGNPNWPYSRFLAWPSGCSWQDDSQSLDDEYGIATYYWAGQNSYGYATPTTFPYRECPADQTSGNSSTYPVAWFEYKPLAFNLSNYAKLNRDSVGNTFVPNKSVKLRIHTLGCSATAHWAYGLFTATLIPGLMSADVCGDEGIHLSVPWGFVESTYEWHYGYDSADATNRYLDLSDPVPGITPEGQNGLYIDPSQTQVYPYYRCEMKSYTGAPFIYEAYVKFHDIVSDFTYEQDFSAEEVVVQFHDSSTVYTITPPTTPPSLGGAYDTVTGSVQHLEWYVKHNGAYLLFAEDVAAPEHAFTPEEIDGNDMATVMLKTYAGGCVDSVEKTFPLSLVAVPEHSADRLTLYPNPTTGLVSISANKEILRVELFSLEGRPVTSIPLRKNSGQVDLSSYATGCYAATIHFADGTSEQVKIIKQ